jgi:hypothetical protein
MRPAGSATESAFIDKYVASIPGATQDIHRNYHVIVGENSPVLWSCHTDTVHTREGRQTVHVDPQIDMVGLSRKSKRSGSNCLGADDTAGVWLCTEMIKAGVAGHYIFHFGEENGGIGSQALADKPYQYFDGIKYAIALDRKGYSDVITHQFGECASDTFAESLASAINLHMPASRFPYKPSSHGIFTDTANYVGLIGECTNLSVGYFGAHTSNETLDYRFLDSLLFALIHLDASTLIAERLPQDNDFGFGKGWTINTSSHHWNMNGNRNTPKPKALPQPAINAFTDWCIECDRRFQYDESTAIRYTKFCSRYCEDQHTLRKINTRHGFDTTPMVAAEYLSPDYWEVQQALAADTGGSHWEQTVTQLALTLKREEGDNN